MSLYTLKNVYVIQEEPKFHHPDKNLGNDRYLFIISDSVIMRSEAVVWTESKQWWDPGYPHVVLSAWELERACEDSI